MAGSSSSLPSSGEANPYPYPSHVFVPNFVSAKLSGRDTYDVWQMQMMCLLESHDMLGFISSQSHALRKEKVGDDDHQEFFSDTTAFPDDMSSAQAIPTTCHEMMWRRSDALVKGWILGSLSQQTLEYFVKPISNKDLTAKDVWDKLLSLYVPPVHDDAAAEGDGSSSSLPSSGEANPYPYPSHVCAPNFVTVKLSGQDTYDVWQTQMWCLLESHDMLGFISLRALGKENVGDDHMLWKRSDALVKGWILGSLSQETLKYVVNILKPITDFTAKQIWDKLLTVYGPNYVQDDAAAQGGGTKHSHQGRCNPPSKWVVSQ